MDVRLLERFVAISSWICWFQKINWDLLFFLLLLLFCGKKRYLDGNWFFIFLRAFWLIFFFLSILFLCSKVHYIYCEKRELKEFSTFEMYWFIWVFKFVESSSFYWNHQPAYRSRRFRRITFALNFAFTSWSSLILMSRTKSMLPFSNSRSSLWLPLSLSYSFYCLLSIPVSRRLFSLASPPFFSVARHRLRSLSVIEKFPTKIIKCEESGAWHECR